MRPLQEATIRSAVTAAPGVPEIAQALGATLASLAAPPAAFALALRAADGEMRVLAGSDASSQGVVADPRRIERILIAQEPACVLCVLPHDESGRAALEDAFEHALPALSAIARLAVRADALARSEARLLAALDGLPHPFWIMDPDHTYAVQNRHDRDAFGDLVGRRLEHTDLPETMVAQWRETHDRVLAGETLRIDLVKETASGQIVGETVMAPIRVGDEMVGLVGLSIDRTERARVETELRRNQARLRDFLASTSDWLWETDAEHRFTAVYADAGASGVDYAGWIGRTRWDVWGIDCDRDPAWVRYRDLVRAREPMRGHVLPLPRRDGTTRFIELTARPVHDEEGVFLGYRGATRDVTDRERIAERLRRSDLVAKLTKNPIIVSDAQARIVWVNPAFEELTGYRLEEALGRRADELLQGPQSDPETTRRVREALARGEGVRTQVVNRTKDGRFYHADLDARPILSESGELEGFIAVETDITALMAAQARIEAIIGNVAAGIVLQDETGAVVDCNAEAARLLGLSREEALGRASVDPRWGTLYEDGTPCPGEDHPGMRALRLRSDVRDATIGVHTPAGELRWLRVNAKLLEDIEGKITILSSFTDITADRNHSRSLAAAKEETERALAELDAYRAALDRHAMVAALDARGRVTYVNDLLCETTGRTRAELVGRRPPIARGTALPRGFMAQAWRDLANGRSWRGQLCTRAKDGTLLWIDATLVPMGDAKSGDAAARAVAICYDIGERKRAEAAVEAEMARRTDAELLLRDVLDTIPDAVAAYDRDDRLILFNEAYKDFYARSAPAIRIGASFEEMLRYGVERGQYEDAGETHEAREAWITERLEAHRACRSKRLIQQLGDGRWLQVRERRSRSGNVVGVRTDITSIKLAEAALKRSAEQDALTGLANRRVLLDTLERCLSGNRAEDGAGTLALLDLDHFKDVNDTLGHDIGDELLKSVAERLRKGVRAGDVVARLGGDEFAILLPGLSDPHAAQSQIAALHRTINAEVSIAGNAIRPGVSIGVTLFPADGARAGDLIKNADIALYQAKARGRNAWSFFDPSLRMRVERRHALAEALRRALAEEAIDVAFQAQVETGSGRHAGFEALVRWTLDGSPVSPAEFVPLADETGLAPQLGRQVIARALARMRTLIDAGHEPGCVAVNVSAGQLKDPAFPDLVRDLLATYRLPPQRLEIEVTETVLLDRSADKIGATLAALHAQGLAIALDDFGTGYASLTHLKRFPVDRLKIDQSFVRDIGVDPEDAVIARTIVNLAHSLGMSVVAEGIETHDQLVFLRLHGCDLAQGYLIHRPSTDLDQLVEHLETTRAPPKRFYRGSAIG